MGFLETCTPAQSNQFIEVLQAGHLHSVVCTHRLSLPPITWLSEASDWPQGDSQLLYGCLRHQNHDLDISKATLNLFIAGSARSV